MCLLPPKSPVLQGVRIRQKGNRRQTKTNNIPAQEFWKRRLHNFYWKTDAAVYMTKKEYLPKLNQQTII